MPCVEGYIRNEKAVKEEIKQRTCKMCCKVFASTLSLKRHVNKYHAVKTGVESTNESLQV